MKSLVILFMLFISMTVSGQAQDQDTVLIYVRKTSSEYIRAFLYSTGALNSYSIFTITDQPAEPTICGALSPNGLFDAFTQIASPTALSFAYTPTDETFATTSWNSDWDPCKLSWLDNETLIVRQIDTSNVVAMFKIENNVLREVPVSLPPTPSIPDLPFAYDTATQYIIPSNNFIKFFYESCPYEPVIPPDGVCISSTRGEVIYDLSLERNVGVIADSVPWILSGQDIDGPTHIYSIGYYSWSPDDRYFWYSTINDQGFDDFRLYDTVLERQLDTGGYNWDLDLFRKPVWSLDSRFVAFWTVGSTDSESADESIRSINVYDTVTQQVIPIDLGFQIADNKNPIIWSPNTAEFVAWDIDGNLYRVDVESVSYELIDTQVTSVIAWSYVAPIPDVELTPPVSCTITVSAADPVGLVNAIYAGNGNGASPDTICLEDSTYTLTAVGNTADGANGLPSITSDITIVGNGATLTRDVAVPAFRLFHVAANGSLTLENLTVSGGNASGATSLPEWWLDSLGPEPFMGIPRIIDEMGDFLLLYGYSPAGTTQYLGPNCNHVPAPDVAPLGRCQFDWIDRNNQGTVNYLGYQVDQWDPLAPSIWPTPES